MKSIIVFLTIMVLCLLIGCTSEEGIMEVSSQQTSTNMKTTNYKEIFSGGITIYQISRDVFVEFLKNPTYKTISEKNDYVASYSKDGQYHITSNVTRFLG